MNPKRKAQFGRDLLEEAVVDLLAAKGESMSHAEIVRALDIASDFEGTQTNYLSWSILGLLVNDGTVRYEGTKKHRVYSLSKRP